SAGTGSHSCFRSAPAVDESQASIALVPWPASRRCGWPGALLCRPVNDGSEPSATVGVSALSHAVKLVFSGGHDDLAEQTVGLMVGPSREEQFAGLGGVPVAEPQPPQAIDHDRPPVRLPKVANAGAVVRVVDVDVAVAEVADNQVSTEIAETVRCEREPPRRV